MQFAAARETVKKNSTWRLQNCSCQRNRKKNSTWRLQNCSCQRNRQKKQYLAAAKLQPPGIFNEKKHTTEY